MQCLLFLLLALLGTAANAQPARVLELGGVERIELRSHLDVLRDPDGLLDVAGARARHAAFEPLGPGSGLNFSYTPGAVWLRLVLHSSLAQPSDWRIELDRAWDQLGDVVVQGNLDPITLLGPPKAIEERVADVIRRAGGRPGHIFNRGHGLIPQVPPDNVKYLVDAVHRLSASPL